MKDLHFIFRKHRKVFPEALSTLRPQKQLMELISTLLLQKH
jgi:hypothetical protein